MRYHFQVEARGKASQGFTTIVRWDNIKQNTLSNLKISPLEMIPHKSRKYRTILDLSFALKVAGWDLPSVNKAKKLTELAEALEQVGTVMTRIMEALVTAPLLEDPIHFSRLDIKDRFWIMVCAVGEEWNFTYVLPTRLVLPDDLAGHR